MSRLLLLVLLLGALVRTTTAAQLAALQATTYREFVRVDVQNADGTWINYREAGGFNWLMRWSVGVNVDQPVWGIQVRFQRENLGHAGPGGSVYSLVPLRTDSALNVDDLGAYAPALDSGRGIRIYVAVLEAGDPGVSDWVLLIEGEIDGVDSSGEDVEVRARSAISAELVDRFIEDLTEYGSDVGIAIQTVMQSIIDDWTADQPALYTPSVPGFDITTTPYRGISVLEALNGLSALIGYYVREEWDNGTGAFRLTFAEPDRAVTVADHVFGPNDYYDVERLDIHRARVRNVIRVTYHDVDGVRQESEASDPTSILRYGRRFYEQPERRDSPINTAGEADAYRDAMLADLKDPTMDKAVRARFFWPVQLGDYYTFEANGVHYDSDQDLAVTGFRHEGTDQSIDTVLYLTGKPVAFGAFWSKRQRLKKPRAALDEKVTTFYQAVQPNAESVGDLWVDLDDDDRVRRWDGSAWVEVTPVLESGSIEINARAERILVGAATAPLAGIGIFIGKDGSDYELRAGDPAGDYIHWDGSSLTVVGDITATTISASSGTIGGWALSASDLSAGGASGIRLQSTARRILLGAATAPLTGVGVFIGLDGSDWELRAGDPAGQYIHWDGAVLRIQGAVIESPGSGTSIGILGWTHNLTFSATDADTVAWTAGTIRLQNGVTYSISAGNTGNMTTDVTRYVYLDSAVSTTVLQVTTTNANAVGANRILVAVCRRAQGGTAATQARFQVFGGSGGIGVFVTVDEIAAATITGDRMVLNTLNATYIASLSFSGKSAVFDTGSVGGWTMSSGTLSSGSVTISATAQRILLGLATAPLTGKGIFIGLDGSDYEFRAGDPASDYVHFDGTTFTIKTNTFTGANPVFTGSVIVQAGQGATRYDLSHDSGASRLRMYNASSTLMGTLTAQVGGFVVQSNSGDLAISAADDVVISSGVGDGIFLQPSGLPVQIQADLDELLRLEHEDAAGNPFISFYQTSTRRGYIQYVDSGDNLIVASEYGGVVIYTGTGGTETAKLTVTSDGRLFGSALHNNAGAVTGTVNQYIASGTYTPTVTGISNVDSTTAFPCQWMRVGNVVTVSGLVTIDPTATATLTRASMTLPIASNFGVGEDAGGVGATTAGLCCAIVGAGATDTADFFYTSTGTAANNFAFTFTYEVL